MTEAVCGTKGNGIEPEQLQDMRTAFLLFDKDGSGYIEPSELKRTVQSMGQNLSDKDIANMVKEADIVDEDGRIGFEEFVVMSKDKDTSKESQAEALDKAFKAFDRDGYITKDEFLHKMLN
ncbi:EF-hand domain-containing protein [Streptomyces sp. NPDC046866]|uniref:EF-hand domain-containing protein n=1 Tax=Streptomyces sp. NPDC046866 TaxID=3154921 RepID=UPI0034528A4E